VRLRKSWLSPGALRKLLERRAQPECGTTYEALVDGVRRERVELLLRRPDVTLTDIPRQAGFSDVRALRRAIRRWHDMTAVELRGVVHDS